MVELIAFLATRHWTSLNLMKKHATLLQSLMNIIFLVRLVPDYYYYLVSSVYTSGHLVSINQIRQKFGVKVYFGQIFLF